MCSNPKNRHQRKATWSESIPEGRTRCFTYDELAKRDKLNLDIFWLKDTSLEDADSLPEPDVLAQEIAEDLQAAIESFAEIANGLRDSLNTSQRQWGKGKRAAGAVPAS